MPSLNLYILLLTFILPELMDWNIFDFTALNAAVQQIINIYYISVRIRLNIFILSATSSLYILPDSRII